jgi:hypothetical protein
MCMFNLHVRKTVGEFESETELFPTIADQYVRMPAVLYAPLHHTLFLHLSYEHTFFLVSKTEKKKK